MKSRTMIAAVVVLFGPIPQVVAGQFEDGLAAAQSGDIATALRLLRRLPNEATSRCTDLWNLNIVSSNVIKPV